MTKEESFDNAQDRLAYVKRQWECMNHYKCMAPHCGYCGKCGMPVTKK